jgi:hypothetical protein
MDASLGKWSRIVVQNPDYIVVKKTAIASEPLIMIRPDENLRRICMSNKPSDVEQRRQLNPEIVEHVRRGENIPLNNYYVSHLARRISPYEARGTGLPVSCFRQLMLFDLIRECKFAQAYDMINPITVVKIGSESYKPTHADLEEWRERFAEASNDRNFKIFTHEGINIERVGAGAGIYDTSNDITQLWKEIYSGLMVPSVVIDGGGDISYANGGISLDILRTRYMNFRNMLANWLKRKIFTPVAQLNEFYDYENGEKKLIIPDIDWNHLSLFDTSDYINVLVQLTGENPKVSKHSLYRSLGLDYEDEQKKIRREAIDAAIAKKEMAALEAMSLNDLRAIDDEDEITEPAQEEEKPLPGQEGEPGGEPGSEPGGDMGGAPPPPPPPPPPPGA